MRAKNVALKNMETFWGNTSLKEAIKIRLVCETQPEASCYLFQHSDWYLVKTFKGESIYVQVHNENEQKILREKKETISRSTSRWWKSQDP